MGKTKNTPPSPAGPQSNGQAVARCGQRKMSALGLRQQQRPGGQVVARAGAQKHAAITPVMTQNEGNAKYVTMGTISKALTFWKSLNAELAFIKSPPGARPLF